ncbi:MAG: hypothetical protein LQ345_005062 [Seirophora villosa]|nr:MAG: hypothetical protein LQ345_005062 [Seirophora villosa]
MAASVIASVPTRFLIISDTHNFEVDGTGLNHHPLNHILRADVVLHCGDLTHCGGASSYRKAVKLLASIDAKLKLVIAGNHDLDLDKEFWDTHLDEGDEAEDHDEAMEVMKGNLAQEAGVVYLDEGTHSFTLDNGAQLNIYVSPYTPAFNDWAFAYEHHEDRFNKPQDTPKDSISIARNPIPDFGHVDVVMTHGPPKGILDHCHQGNAGCPNLLQAINRAKPLLHCFGHIHEGAGAVLLDWKAPDQASLEQALPENLPQMDVPNQFPAPVSQEFVRGSKSLMVNAAINDGANSPVNAPWLVDLLLTPAV